MYSELPMYSIQNVPLLTYAMVGMTAFALGYITMNDKSTSNNESVKTESVKEPAAAEEEESETKGGNRNKKQNKRKTFRRK